MKTKKVVGKKNLKTKILKELNEKRAIIAKKWAQRTIEDKLHPGLPVEELTGALALLNEVMIEYYNTGDLNIVEDFSAKMAARGAQQATKLHQAINLILLRNTIIEEQIIERFSASEKDEVRSELMKTLRDFLFEHIKIETRMRDNLLQQQSQAILELSTPVIRIWDEILALSLIGTIDTARAQQIIEGLLETITRTQATVAIMDITGVPVVDTQVANHILNTIKSAKMLGTDVILTGVSPHNAQTLVKLGVVLDTIITKGSLQAGLKLAFEITKNKVTKDN